MQQVIWETKRSESHIMYHVAYYEPLRVMVHIIIIVFRSVLSVIYNDILPSSHSSLSLEVTTVAFCTKQVVHKVSCHCHLNNCSCRIHRRKKATV
jgi:hypothetical protein